jgi:hypothetical protein
MVPLGIPSTTCIEADKTTGDKKPFCRSWVNRVTLALGGLLTTDIVRAGRQVCFVPNSRHRACAGMTKEAAD